MNTIKRFFLYSTLTCFAVVGVGVASLEGYRAACNAGNAAYARVASYFSVTKIIQVPIEAEPVTISKAISKAAKDSELPKMLILAMSITESGEELRTDRVRFEPEIYKRLPRQPWQTEEEARLQASSIGLMQVIIGLHKNKPECGNNVGELFQIEKNLACGCAVIKECLRYNAKTTDRWERFKKSLVCYNGSSVYADQVISKIAKLTIEGSLS